MGRVTDYRELAQKLKPYIAPWIVAQGNSQAAASAVSGMAVHALNGAYHSGTLAQSQAPWAVTDDEFATHAGNPNAHHDTATVVAPLAISGQQVSLTLGHGVEESGGALRAKLPTNTGIARDSTGLYLAPSTLNTTSTNAVSGSGHTHAVTTTAVGVPSTIVALDASGYTQAVRWIATDRVRTPLLDTASGDLTLSPAGDVVLDPAGGEVYIPGNRTLRSSSWTSGVLGTGWGLQERGGSGKSHLDIRSIYTDELIATTFTADQIRVRSGSDWLGESLGIAARDNSDAKVTIPNVGGGSVRIYVEEVPELLGLAFVFDPGEYILVKTINRSSGLVIRETWGQISSDGSTRTVETGGRQSFLWTTVSGTGGFTLEPGTALIGFGASGGSFIFRSVVEAGRGPFERFATWSTNPYTPANRVSRVEVGDIKNAAGDSTTRYGIAAGNNLALTPTTGFSGFTADNANGAKFYNGSVEMYTGSDRDVWLGGHGLYVRSDDHGVIAFSTDLSSEVNAEANECGRFEAGLSGGYNYLRITAYEDTGTSSAARVELFADGVGDNAQLVLTAIGSTTAITAFADTIGLSGTVTVNGGTVWHSGNDGASSGLYAQYADDATKLGTYAASAYGRLAAANTWTANQQINASLGVGASPTQVLQVHGNGGAPATSGTTQNGIAAYSIEQTYATLYFGAYTASPYAVWLQASARTALGTNHAIALNPNGGGVVVGTTEPLYSAALSVSGNIHSDAAITAENFLQLKTRSGSPGGATGFGRIYYDSGDDKLKYITSGGTVRTLSYT